MRVDTILDLVSGPDVLDVGCAGHTIRPGERTWLHGRLRERFHVTGIDICSDNIERLKSLGFENLHVQSAEEFCLDQHFDTIVAGEVIEHVSNPGRFLRQSRAHLRADGRLVLSTPYVFSLMYAFYAHDHFPKTCQNSEHTTWFCPATISELAKRHGFTVAFWTLVYDFSDTVPSWKYRLYWRLINSVGRLLPDRLTKTNMILVLEPMP